MATDKGKVPSHGEFLTGTASQGHPEGGTFLVSIYSTQATTNSCRISNKLDGIRPTADLHDRIALPGGGQVVDQHARAAHRHEPASVRHGAVHKRAHVGVREGAPRGLPADEHVRAAGPRPQRCAVAGEVSESGCWRHGWLLVDPHEHTL